MAHLFRGGGRDDRGHRGVPHPFPSEKVEDPDVSGVGEGSQEESTAGCLINVGGESVPHPSPEAKDGAPAREIRMHGSEGGGTGNSTGPSYPYPVLRVVVGDACHQNRPGSRGILDARESARAPDRSGFHSARGSGGA